MSEPSPGCFGILERFPKSLPSGGAALLAAMDVVWLATVLNFFPVPLAEHSCDGANAGETKETVRYGMRATTPTGTNATLSSYSVID